MVEQKSVKNEVTEIKPEKKNKRDLKGIENKLVNIFEADRRNWIECYKLMEKVNAGQLWAGEYKNFTAWVRHLAAENNYSESVLWTRYTAGENYIECRKNDSSLPELDNVKGSPESINLAVRILKNSSGYDILTNDKIKNLMLNVANGNVSRRQLQDENRSFNKQRAEKRKNEITEEVSEKDKYISIALATKVLKGNHEWLGAGENDKNKDAYYRVMSDIVVNDPKTKKAVSINLVVLENLRNPKQENDDVVVNGIALMNRKSKFEKTETNCRIAEMCDQFWILAPEKFKSDALAYLKETGKQWGVLILKKKEDALTVELVQDPSDERSGDQKLRIITACLTSDPADVGGKLHAK